MSDFDQEMSRLIQGKRFQEAAQLLNEQQEYFWIRDYPKMSEEEKVNFWSGRLNRQMRRNEEAGLDRLAVFSTEEYDLWVSREVDFPVLLPEILVKLDAHAEKVKELLGLI